jgi:aryl-alcohol dehydrogenase-like predicted oxidoreductase
MIRAQTILEDHGIPLASNQVEFSLLERSAERAGLLKACQENSITLIAYSPLASGVLTGKYSPDKPLPGPRGRRYGPEYMKRIQPIIDQISQIGVKYGDKTPAQVALNWVMAKGAVPIPGIKTRSQALENLGALGWQLSSEDIAVLDGLSWDPRS